MRASLRRDLSESERTMPNALGTDQPHDRLAPAHLLATQGDACLGILDEDDDFDPDELFVDLGVGD